jgi:hypothetical protein
MGHIRHESAVAELRECLVDPASAPEYCENSETVAHAAQR